MPKVDIYTKYNCPYCEMAKSLFTQKGVTFKEINYVTKKIQEFFKNSQK